VAFPQFDPNVTVLHLLTHTSGVPDYCDEELGDDFEALWLERPSYAMRTPRDFLPLFQNRAMKFRPGERFSYSNAGFILLGLIAAQAAGQSFTELIMARVLTPAGMADSGYFALDRLPERTATGYIEDGDGWRSNIYAVPVVGQPDGGAFTTAPDMATFWAALREHRLLSPELTALMLRPHVAAGREGRYYGLGVWLQRQDETVTEWFVMGSDPGVALESGYFPARDVQISVLGNTGDPTWPIYAALRKLVE
jgi:CubicO group peptidase (beta-lactamase class C family)